MDRRKFLATSGMLGAGLLGAGNAASSLLHAESRSDFESNLNLEDKPVAFSVPPLPYPNDALEPYIDARTMEIHHDKHHSAYVTNLNKALEGHPDLRSEEHTSGLQSLTHLAFRLLLAKKNRPTEFELLTRLSTI